MKHQQIGVAHLVAVVGRSFALVIAATAPAGDSGFEPGQVVVRLQQGASIDDLNTRYGSSTITDIASRRWFLLAPPAGVDEQSFAQLLTIDPDVARVELNSIGADTDAGGGSQSIFLSINQFEYQNDPVPTAIGAAEANSVSLGAAVTVAVIDTGIDATHPLLAGRIATGGFNFIDGSTDTRDIGDGIDSNGDGRIDEFVGHGTFVAGLVTRIAPASMVLPIRALDSDGQSNAFLMAQGLYHAIDQQVHVINISLGTQADPFILADAVSEAESAGIIVVASAGNDDTSSPPRSPASLRSLGVLGVAATDLSFVRAPFSNYGDWVSLSAPGVDITSLLPDGGFGRASGTSFAAPIVAGTAALLRSACLAAPGWILRETLLSSAMPINQQNPSFQGMLGAGALDAAAALGAGAGQALPCWSDVDHDGRITFHDIAVVLTNFGTSYGPGQTGPGDADRDSLVDFDDLAIVLVNFGSY